MPSVSAGTSTSADVTFSTLSNLPPGEHALTLDVSWDGGALEPRVVTIQINDPRPISTALLAPAQFSPGGPFFARLRTFSSNGTLRADGGFLIHMPYYDAELDAHLSDGQFDPLNPDHTPSRSIPKPRR